MKYVLSILTACFIFSACNHSGSGSANNNADTVGRNYYVHIAYKEADPINKNDIHENEDIDTFFAFGDVAAMRRAYAQYRAAIESEYLSDSLAHGKCFLHHDILSFSLIREDGKQVSIALSDKVKKELETEVYNASRAR